MTNVGGPVSWFVVAALWWSAFRMLRRRAFRAGDEAFLGAGLLTVFEATAAAALLGGADLLHRKPVFFAAAACVVAHALAAAYADPAPVRRADAPAPWLWPLWPAAAFAAGVLAVRLAIAGAIPVESWDGLSYHMPILWRWVSQGNFDLVGWAGPQRWFPWNGELLPAWLAVLDGRSLDSAKLAQVIALPLLAGAGAVLGRRLAGRAWSGACALALGALPIALIHAGVPYVDGLEAGFWLACAAFAAAWDRSGRREHMLFAALGFGLALGTKSTIYFLAPLLLPFAVALFLSPRTRRPFLRALPAAAAVAAAAGAWCFLKNWVVQGSPIYPYALKLGGVQIFGGPLEPGQLLVSVERWFVDSRAGWLTYPFREHLRVETGYTGENGFGPLFAAGWLLMPWSAWQAWRRRDRAGLSFLALLPATALFFLTLHPTREPRYVIFLAGIPIVGLAMALRDLRGGPRLAALALWGAGVAWGATGVLDYLSRDPGLHWTWEHVRSGQAVDPHEYYHRQYSSLGAAWEALDARLQPGDVVAVNYGELIFPWAGVPPRGQVFILSRRENDLPDSLWADNDEDWLALFDRVGARYLALWAPPWYPEEGTMERSAMAKRPGQFASIGSWDSKEFGRVELFELKRMSRPADMP